MRCKSCRSVVGPAAEGAIEGYCMDCVTMCDACWDDVVDGEAVSISLDATSRNVVDVNRAEEIGLSEMADGSMLRICDECHDRLNKLRANDAAKVKALSIAVATPPQVADPVRKVSRSEIEERGGLAMCLILVWAVCGMWYTNWKGPLTPNEIDHYMSLLRSQEAANETKLAPLRHFMESDTGNQFFMINSLDLAKNKPLYVDGADPAGEDASSLMRKYAEHMIPAMLSRASHPAIFGRAVAPALDVVGISGADTWTEAAIVRYRSRRDLMDIATHTAFRGKHAFKIAALEKTIAFPIEARLQFFDLRILMGLLVLAIPTLADVIKTIRLAFKQTPAKEHQE